MSSCGAKVGGREGYREREQEKEQEKERGIEKEKYIQFGREASTDNPKGEGLG